jgi:TrmH family RNA methyltransferase
MYRVSEPVFALVSDVKSPQGILAIVKRPLWRWDAIVSRTPSPILVLDGVQDPGNLATIVRTAEAAGAAGLITTPGTTRLFSPKALRGAMGSTFRLPCLEHRTPEDIHRELLKASYSLLLASMPSKEKRSTPYTAIDWKRPIALVLGQEGSGSSPAWNALADSCLHIPMRTPVESLNVAAAAAILLYEFVRQNAPLDTP